MDGKEDMYEHNTFQTFPGLGVAIRDSRYVRQRGSVAWLVQLHSQACKKGKSNKWLYQMTVIFGIGSGNLFSELTQMNVNLHFWIGRKTNEQKPRKQGSATSPTIKSSGAALSSPNIKNKSASGDYLWNQNGPAVGCLPWETGYNGFISCSVCIARSRARQHMCTAVNL